MKKTWAGLLLALGAAAQPAFAATEIYIDSPYGDYVGEGREHYFSDTTSFVQAQYYPSSGVQFNWDGSWTLWLVARPGEDLVPGNYEGAVRYPFNGPRTHAMSLSGLGHGCNTLEGWFEIHEAVFDGTTVVAFAADFMQSCDHGPWLFGAIRVNSTMPLHPGLPFARTPREVVAEEQEPVLLDGMLSFDREGAIDFAWEQTSGVAVPLSNATRARAHFLAPQVNPGGASLQFDLTVSDDDGNSDTETVQVKVYDTMDPRTRAFLDSESGDFIGRSLAYWLDEANSEITATASLDGRALGLQLKSDETWGASFRAPPGITLQPGLYVDAQDGAYADPAFPALNFAGEGRGCNSTYGAFRIHEIEIVGATVLRLAVDFIQHCEYALPVMYGTIRYNSSVPLYHTIPFAAAAPVIQSGTGELITLDGSGSARGSGGLTYLWTQTGGAPVALSNAGTAITTFTAPAVAPGGDVLTFELRVTDAEGNVDTAIVTVHVTGVEPQTVVFLESTDPNDNIGQGQTLTFAAETIHASKSSSPHSRGVHFEFDDEVSPSDKWRGDFQGPLERRLDPGVYWAEPVSRVLDPGSYEGAERFPFNSPLRPGLSITAPHRGCIKVGGWFEVHEAVYRGSSEVVSFAADLLQSCDGAAPMFVAVRINSTVPLHRAQPYARATGPGVATEGEAITLDGSKSFDRGGPLASHAWSQIAGPTVALSDTNAPALSFTAPPVVPGGAFVQFRLVVTDTDGHADSETVGVYVYDTFDYRRRALIKSDPNDFIGQGQTWRYDEGNALIGGSFGGALVIHTELGTSWWDFGFATPDGSFPEATKYGGAIEMATVIPLLPHIEISGGGRACHKTVGGFEIHELGLFAYTVLWASVDAVQICMDTELGLDGTSATYAAVRVNSAVPLERPVPFAIAGKDRIVQLGQDVTVALDGTLSRSFAGNPMSYFWQQVGGPLVTLSDVTSATPTFAAVEPGEYRFELSVVDGPGRIDTDEVRIIVRGNDEPQTYLIIDADPGHYVARGQEHWSFSDDNASFLIPRWIDPPFSDNGFSLWVRSHEFWSVSFSEGSNHRLTPGLYENVTRWPGPVSGVPKMDYEGAGRGCAQMSGWFRVYQITYEDDGNGYTDDITSAAIDFEHHCSTYQGEPLGVARGKLRINFRPDNEPVAKAGPDKTVEQLTPVILDGSKSVDYPGPLSYDWHQVSGPEVTLEEAGSAQASFFALPLPEGTDEQVYVFELTVTDDDGFTSTDTTTITVVTEADRDGDGVRDSLDAFPEDPTETVDTDGDGHGDNGDVFPSNPAEWADSDGDGVGDNADAFDNDPTETVDSDGDGHGDNGDAFPNNPAEWADSDGDGVGDNADAFDNDPTETTDSDGDGVGDNSDVFPNNPAEWADSDGDGVGNNADPFDNDPTEWADSDNDGHGNNSDVFPNNPAEWADTDGDGVGDNADAFDNDPTEWADSDGDGHGNNSDVFPNNPAEWADSDGDGVGNNADPFDNDPTEWADSDGDGVGNNADAFDNDPTETADSDGDGVGNNGDAFPNNPAEWADSDGDGVGNNADAFDNNPGETSDNDGDGTGDNADTDDDNDGKSDSAEALAPNGGDGNQDGIPDSRQAGVATFADTSGGTTTVAVGAGATLSLAQGVANPNPSGTPAGITFDRGFFAFSINVAPGGAATVEIRLHGATAPTRYYKYGPQPGTGPGFYEFNFNGTTGAQFLTGRIVLHFVDGGRGDADGVANGVITDPGAPAWGTPSSGSGGGGGGGGAPSGGLLALFAALAALRRVRARRVLH